MFDQLIGEAKAAGFIVSEIITDKDSAMNAVYCKHFPEGTITYCANHCAKTMHKDLLKIRPSKCQVRGPSMIALLVFFVYSARQTNWGSARGCPSLSLGAVKRP